MVRKTYFRKNLRRQPKHLLIIPSPPIFSKSKFRCDLTNGSGRRVQTHLWLWVFKKDSKSSLCKDLDNHQGLTSLEINLFLQGKKITGIRILIVVLDSRKEWRIFTDIWEESNCKTRIYTQPRSHLYLWAKGRHRMMYENSDSTSLMSLLHGKYLKICSTQMKIK